MNGTRLLTTLLAIATTSLLASEITTVPGPNDQGGMLMPMISIVDADDLQNPTTGQIEVEFHEEEIPTLRSLEEYQPGSWFATDAAWKDDLGSPEGIGGTPAENAGNGGLFSNRYGLMFMAMPTFGTANLPLDKSFGVRLLGTTTPAIRSHQLIASDNHWDPIFTPTAPQLLWNGAMWHNYFTLPADTPSGIYSATFEVYIADRPFTTGTGAADYTPEAIAATIDPNFTPATLEYLFRVERPGAITYPIWLATHFTAEEIADPAQTAPTADYGNRGIANLLRYAFGLDPKNPDHRHLPTIGQADTAPTIAYRRFTDASDLRIRLERSTDLQRWEPTTPRNEDIISTTDSIATIEATTDLPTEADRLFLRLKLDLH